MIKKLFIIACVLTGLVFQAAASDNKAEKMIVDSGGIKSTSEHFILNSKMAINNNRSTSDAVSSFMGFFGPYVAGFNKPSVIKMDSDPPTAIVKIKEVPLKTADYVTKRPKFNILLNDLVALDPSKTKVILDESTIIEGAAVIRTFTVSQDAKTQHLAFTPDKDLETEDIRSHAIKIDGYDLAGNLTHKEITDLKVAAGAVRVVGPVLVTPRPFSHNRDKFITIIYNLNADAKINAFVYAPGNNVIEWHNSYEPGMMGGQAGYNEISWDGNSSATKQPAGNAIYVFQIVAEGKILSKAYIVIFN